PGNAGEERTRSVRGPVVRPSGSPPPLHQLARRFVDEWFVLPPGLLTPVADDADIELAVQHVLDAVSCMQTPRERAEALPVQPLGDFAVALTSRAHRECRAHGGAFLLVDARHSPGFNNAVSERWAALRKAGLSPLPLPLHHVDREL